MPRAPKKLSDDECLDVMQAMLMKTIKSSAALEKDRREAARELLKLLSIKHKIKGEDDENFFSKRG